MAIDNVQHLVSFKGSHLFLTQAMMCFVKTMEGRAVKRDLICQGAEVAGWPPPLYPAGHPLQSWDPLFSPQDPRPLG